MKNIIQVSLGINIYLVVLNVIRSDISNAVEAAPTKSDVLWPNATVPYYIDPNHFSPAEVYSIMTSFTLIASKTCIKFLPLNIKPENEQFLLFENPDGERQCSISAAAFQSFQKFHRLSIGYDCLKTPVIETIVLKVLGVPVNDKVNTENLHLTENRIPNHNFQEHYIDHLDYQRVNFIYRHECQKRDYENDQGYTEVCQNKSKAQRIKRDTESDQNNNTGSVLLFKNDNANNITKLEAAIKELGLEKELNTITELIFNLVNASFTNAKEKFCYKPFLRTIEIEFLKPKDDRPHKEILREEQEDKEKAKALMHELSLWKTDGLNMIGAMAQYVMKNVSVVLNLVNFENPDPQTLNAKHYENIQLTTYHF